MASEAEPPPPPLPSGMALLYSNRLVLDPSGEPRVPIGLIQDESHVTLQSEDGLILDYFEDGHHKRGNVPAGHTLRVNLVDRTQPLLNHEVVLGTFERANVEGIRRARSLWTNRGHKVTSVEIGLVVSIQGQTIDTRAVQLVRETASAAEATRLVERIHQDTGDRPHAQTRLRSPPWGLLGLTTSGSAIGRATSYVRIQSQGGSPIALGHDGQRYEGEIYITVGLASGVTAVNVLGIESILRGVVPSEMFASAPSETLKAQAVAARNQLFAKLSQRHFADPFHLCNTQHCQVYRGLGQAHPRSDTAIRQTGGELLFHQGNLVDTVYSSTCGGHTEDNEAVWGNRPDPALRGRLDLKPGVASPRLEDGEAALHRWYNDTPKTYCSDNHHVRSERFRWTRTYSTVELVRLVRKRWHNVRRVRGLHVSSRGPGGRVIALTFDTNVGPKTIVHELPIRRLLDGLYSGAFVIGETRDPSGVLRQVTLTGGGWGHGVGMCQLGAVGRAEAGQTYDQILQHYYNGASIKRLY